MSNGATEVPSRTLKPSAKKVKWLLALMDVSQSALGRKAGIDHTRISRWLGGQGEFPAAVLLKIAKALNVPYDYLADPSRTEKPDLALLEKERLLAEAIKVVGIEEAYRRIVAGIPPSSGRR